MAEPADPQHANRHGLGPHVVGQRVVVRRVLRGEVGPTGGPALTDVLGVCTAWGDGICVLQPEVGAEVRIAISDIVSGKPVPPRPSARHRVAPREAQLRALALWPGLRTEPLGDWLLRHSPGSTARRANSVLAMGPSGVADDYERVLAFYAGTTGRPIAAVLPGSEEERTFRSRGWGPESHDADTLFQIAGVARARRGLPDPPEDVQLDEAGDDLVTVRLGEQASGVAAYDRDWVGFRSIVVEPGERRQGLALLVMAALLEWGAERGATTAYLQVIGDNLPALRLYERLGFTIHHAYRYLTPAPR